MTREKYASLSLFHLTLQLYLQLYLVGHILF
jgi:hypothetical protein